MDYDAGIDLSLECSSVCVVDASGKIFCESKVASEPEALLGYFRSLGVALARIGLEAGPLSQWPSRDGVPSPERWIRSDRELGRWHCDHAYLVSRFRRSYHFAACPITNVGSKGTRATL